MRAKHNHGFTLVELLIVVLIIGILATVAIPIFNGQRDKARNAVAISTVRNALSAAKAYYSQKESYDGLDAVGLNKMESTLQVPADPALWGNYNPPGPTANPQEVYTYGMYSTSPTANWPTGSAGNENGIIMCVVSQGDTVYCIRSNGEKDEYTTGTDHITGTTSWTPNYRDKF
jgi:prepilin-type N-terminal cleavage/methylation domain-containing protein